ncbi:MAG: hypothetical protein HFJ43_04305 [Clostridia bacterium]|nr:hypothetical protein [Clostridia bacterium]
MTEKGENIMENEYYLERLAPSFLVTRSEMIENLQKQVKRLKSTVNMSEYLTQYITKVDLYKIQEKIDLTVIKGFADDNSGEMMIHKKEIPEGCLLETIFLLRFLAEKTGIEDFCIFDNLHEIVGDLISSNSNIERRIGMKLEEKNLCEMKIDDFIVSEKIREFTEVTTRYETIMDIQEQVKILKSKKVGELISEGKIKELEALQKEIDSTTIVGFFKNRYRLHLGMEEIPEGCLLETIFFMRFAVHAVRLQNRFDDIMDVDILYDAGLFIEELISSENEVEQRIGKRMYEKELFNMELKELFDL